MATAPKAAVTAATTTAPEASTPTQVPATAPAATPDTSLANVAKILADTPPVPTNPNAILLAKAREEAAKAAAARVPAPSAPVPVETAPEPSAPSVVDLMVAATEAADKAIEAARAALPPVASVATLAAPAGIAGSTNGALRPDESPKPSTYRAVGPGTSMYQQVPSAMAAVNGEALVKMTFPRKIHLTLQDYSVVVFEKGVNMVPVGLSTHPYVISCGAVVVPEPETRVVPPVQFGVEGKTAPVVK